MGIQQQRGKRGSKDYVQISGYVPKALGLDFKADCIKSEVAISDALEQMIAAWKPGATEKPAADKLLDRLRSLFERCVQGERIPKPELGEIAYETGINLETLIKIQRCLSPK
jgi:hypothetical protein